MKFAFKKSSFGPVIALAALLVAFMASPALAVTTTSWVGPSGNWTVVANWNNGVPAVGYDANLTSTTNKTATLNTVTPLLGTVTVEGTGGATFTLRQTSSPSGSLNATNEIIGNSNGGKGVYSQSAGNNTITNTLTLGFGDGSTGTYNKTAGNLSAGAMIVGRDGTGFFNLSSGKAAVGTAQVDGTEPFSLIVGGIHNGGADLIGEGTVNLNSSTFKVAGGEVIGQTGKGTLNQSSSTHTVGGYFIVGNWGGSVGEATISSSTLKVGGSEHIGDTGTGKMTLSSSTHEVGGDLWVGKYGGSKGDLISSSSSILVKGNATIGGAGPGTFTASSSSITVNGDYTLAQNASGTQTLSSSSLKVKGNEIIGQNASATFTSNSSSNSAKTITIGGAPATYTLNNSSMTATDPAAPANAIWIKGPYTPTSPTDPVSTTGGNLLIKGTSTVNGNVTNDGLIKTTSATVTWNGTVTNNSAYISDPSSQTFSQDLVVSSNGYIQATHSQDIFIVKGDFINTSTKNNLWDTDNATLIFTDGSDATPSDHNFYIAGLDYGIISTAHNFNWSVLNIANQNIYLKDGNHTSGGAEYVRILIGADVDTTNKVVRNIFGDPTDTLTIYYDKNNPDNAYLKSLDYTFASGRGHLYADDFTLVPLPPSVLLMGSGLLGLGLLGWRRKRLKG